MLCREGVGLGCAAAHPKPDNPPIFNSRYLTQTGKDLRIANRQANDAGAGMRTQYRGNDGDGVEGAFKFFVHRLA